MAWSTCHPFVKCGSMYDILARCSRRALDLISTHTHTLSLNHTVAHTMQLTHVQMSVSSLRAWCGGACFDQALRGLRESLDELWPGRQPLHCTSTRSETRNCRLHKRLGTQLVTKMRVVEIEHLNVKTAFQPHNSAAGLPTVWERCAQRMKLGETARAWKLDTPSWKQS
jgi:hypothetical protein